jgi:hypothetical protein
MFKRIFIAAFVITALGLWVFFNLHRFLAPTKPVADASILVIDTWLSDYELKGAVKNFKAGKYTHVLVPGGQMDHGVFFQGMGSKGELTAILLIYKGMPYDKITPLLVKSVKKDRTYQSALTVKAWLARHKLSDARINVYTSGTHARRSWLLYRKAFGNDWQVGIIGAPPADYDAKEWWKTSNGFRTVIDEAIAYLYARLFFHPDF